MAAYLDIAGLKLISDMPSSYIDLLDQTEPGWIAAMLDQESATLDTRLCKRYQTPFIEPYPVAVKGWLAHVATLRCWKKRGVNPADEQFREFKDAAERAQSEVQQAADSNTGLFDLPLRVNDPKSPSAISKGAPLVASEQSPYVWTTQQAEIGHQEDQSGTGYWP